MNTDESAVTEEECKKLQATVDDVGYGKRYPNGNHGFKLSEVAAAIIHDFPEHSPLWYCEAGMLAEHYVEERTRMQRLMRMMGGGI